MKKKYLYNNQIMDATDVMDAAKQSNMDIDNYIQKAGIKEINDTYSLNGKEYTAEDILDAANQSKLGFDDYIQKAGFENTFKKKEGTPNPYLGGQSQSQSTNGVLKFRGFPNPAQNNGNVFQNVQEYEPPNPVEWQPPSSQQIKATFDYTANKLNSPADNTQFNPAQQSLKGQEAIQNQPKINAEKKQLHDEAVDNSIQKYFNNKGINAPKGSALYNQQKAEVENALNNGIVQVGIDPKTGERGLYKTTSFWQDLKNGWNESVKGSDDAANWNSWTPQQQVDYLDSNESSQDKNSPFLGNKSSYYGSVGKFIGGSAPTLGKTALGALLGATLVAAARETGGMSLEGLSAASAFMFTAPDMVKQSSMNEQIRAYYQVRKDNPNISKTDAMQQAHSRMWAGGTQGLLNAALMTEGQLPNLEKGISGESKGVLLNAFNHTVKPAIKFGVASGGITAATEAEGNLEGVNTDANQIFNDSMKSAGENASQAFLLGLAFHAPTLVPALLKNAAKYGLVKNADLDEIQKIEQLNESAGNTPQGTTQQVMDDLRGYKQALDKTPESLTPDTKAQVAGLIQKKDNIQAEAQTKDEATQNIYETQINGINNQIEKEVDSNEPYQHEVDNLTGNTYAEELKNSEQLQPEPLNAGKGEASSVLGSEGDKRSDADIENRMTELSKLHDDASNKEFDLLEKEMAKRERATVFNVPLSEAKEAIDALMKKEKEMPNGWGSFITKRDASESKSVIDDYSNPKEISDDQLKRDFKNALMGRPATWYADGLKLRESMKEAANRGIDINDMLKEVAKEFTKDGYDINTAKEMVAYYLNPVFEGSQKIETNKNRIIEPLNAGKGEASSVSSEGIEPNQSFRTMEMGNDEGKDETPEARKQMKVRMSNGDIPMDGENGKGETGKQFANRILSEWNNVKDNEPENTTVVTHSSVLKAIKAYEDMKDKPSDPSNFTPEQWKEFSDNYNKESTENGDLETFKGTNGNIHVIRHGQTEDNENNKFRSGNTPLTEKGIKQAEQSGKELNNLTNGEVPKIISSDLPRAMHSSDIINSQLKTKENAIPESKTGEILQREQSPTGETGGERGRMEQRQQGNETPPPSQEKGETTSKEENDLTSIKNEIVNERRKQLGLESSEKVMKKTFGETWKEAKNKLDEGYDPRDLVEELNRKPRPISDVEDAILLHEQNTRELELINANKKINEAFDKGDEQSINEWKVRRARILDNLQDIYNAGKKAGTETARGLSARQMIADRKYNLVNMLSEKRAANGGEKLSDSQVKIIEGLHQKIKDTQSAYDEYVKN